MSAYRHWRRSRPFWAGLWSILGGVIIAALPATGLKFVMFSAGSLLALGVMVGVVVAILGLFLWLQPTLRYIAGVLIIVLSLFSFMTSDFGGFLLGMILGMVGGSLALAWAPDRDPAAVATAPSGPPAHDPA